jgi:hypothetical protein
MNVQSLAAIPAGATVWVTFAGGADKQQLLLNWIAHVRQLEVPHLVVRPSHCVTAAQLPGCL